MDTSWIELPNNHVDYINGVIEFMILAKENLLEGRTRCPCKNCKVDKWLLVDKVENHILFKGFYKPYKNWIHHRKDDAKHRNGLGSSEEIINNQSVTPTQDDMRGLLDAAFGHNILNSDDHMNDLPTQSEGVEFSEEATRCDISDDSVENAKYENLLKAANEELYAGCSSFSKLSFLLNLFHLKSTFHWSAESFNMLLQILLDAFPHIKDFPTSYYECKKMIKDLGLGYEKIDACPNNCTLYWGDSSELDSCPVCKTSRWKTSTGKEDETVDENVVVKLGEPDKVMRYFPLIPRLKRIYMSSETTENMIWHHTDRVKDGKLRHPADALAWVNFDAKHLEFSSDPRNVRLGLPSDGFNPYRLINTTYSTWPVVLIPYNLPPWLVMKPSSFILSMIIPGKSSLGNDIDMYLHPLIHELKVLWEGIDVFDAYKREWFKLHAALMWTINDFPAYGMLSGWSTKGYKACPICANSTSSYRFAGKICYVGCRKWLPDDHPYRSQDELFDGTDEYGHVPVLASGTTILRQQEKVRYVYGTSKKAAQKKRPKQDVGTSNDGVDIDEEENVLWNRRSMLFDLPYWESNSLRHNLDVMHIEKNVCDIWLGTILDTDKSRDDTDARRAIEELGAKPHLWLHPRPDREPVKPLAPYTLSLEEKQRFLRVLKKLRVPNGYGSNLSRCVNMKKRKLMGLKSHDNHVLMQDILPIALRASGATQVVDLLSEMSSFFKYLCSTTLSFDELDALQARIILTLCEIKKVFLPTFFTIMVHLLIHLVDEAKLGGPVHYRWMYPIERYLAHLKSYVSNKAQPEGSIAEGYISEETITFCSRYLEGVQTVFNKPKRNDDTVHTRHTYLYDSGGRVVGMTKLVQLDERSLKQAHRYILLHSDEIYDLKAEFIHQKHQRIPRVEANGSIENEWIINEFSEWLQNKVHSIDTNTEEGSLRKALAGGLNKNAKRMKAFMINGYKFQTIDREKFLKTQNSGVMVEADGVTYYGKVKDIYELDYYGAYKVVVFRCQWVDIEKCVRIFGDGGVSVSFSKLMHTGRFLTDDPFIFSSQAKQVMYVEDELRKGWFHVIQTKPRDLFDLGNKDSES